MNIWQILEWAAWIISGALLLYIFVDMIRVGMQYPEDLLLSSREGLDELIPGGEKDE